MKLSHSAVPSFPLRWLALILFEFGDRCWRHLVAPGNRRSKKKKPGEEKSTLQMDRTRRVAEEVARWIPASPHWGRIGA